MNKNIPSLDILDFYQGVFQEYNSYRKEAGMLTFCINTNPLKPMNMDKGFQLNFYLYESEPVRESYFSGQEKLTYRVDILVINRRKDDDAYKDLLALSHDLRQIIMHCQNRQLNLGFEATNLTHPTFGIVTNATENPDVDYAFGQLEFSVDVDFEYARSDVAGVDGDKIDWNIFMNQTREEK